jgi:glycosyltransferase involved in cell wall biosynthesis
VIAESLAAGLPLISTPAGIAPDVIDEHNGLLVDFRDEAALAEKIDFMLDNYQNYNSLQISEKAKERFKFDKVAQRLIDILNSCKK